MWILLFHVGRRGKRQKGAGRSVRDAGQCVRERIDVFGIRSMRSGCPPLRAGHSLCGDESLWAARPQWLVVDLRISQRELGPEQCGIQAEETDVVEKMAITVEVVKVSLVEKI